MTLTPVDDPTAFKPIRQLHHDGRIPHFGLRQVLKLCSKRKFPSVMIGKAWHSTEPWIQEFFWDHIYSQDTSTPKKVTKKRGYKSDAPK
jgi:hypothetical protein